MTKHCCTMASRCVFQAGRVGGRVCEKMIDSHPQGQSVDGKAQDACRLAASPTREQNDVHELLKFLEFLF